MMREGRGCRRRDAGAGRCEAAAVRRAARAAEKPKPSIQGQQSLIDQRLPKLNALGRVHLKHSDRRAPCRGATHDDRSGPLEVFTPCLFARIEQGRDSVRNGIDAAEIRTFTQIASQAGKGKVVRPIVGPMLNGNDVIDGKPLLMSRLRQSAVFAPLARATAHELSGSSVHRESGGRRMLA